MDIPIITDFMESVMLRPSLKHGRHLGYGGYYGHHLGYAGHYGYPYNYGFYGKRDAEAKPEADPALLYGGYYGHHLGYAGHYGYAGYPYAYWG